MKNIIILNETNDDKNMSFGCRDISHTPLSKEEIEFVKQEIKAIDADETKFIFNDERHINKSTCYNHKQDVIFVTRNVFPDSKSNSTHPRDTMSVRAVLAHEYYGHRTFRDEYLSDDLSDGCQTTEEWADECRASLTAAKITPNLTDEDRRDLVLDAKYRAKEAFHHLDDDEFMKGVLYGYKPEERNITSDTRGNPNPDKQGLGRLRARFQNIGDMPQMQNSSETDYQWES